MRSILGRFVALTLLGAGSSTTALAPEPAAAAAIGSARPIAIAVDSDGTSYVGYAGGGALTRINNKGARVRSLALDEDGPVVGLVVDSSDHLWVAYDDAVSKLSLDGDVIRSFERTAATACADDQAHSSARFGGLALGGDSVYVASRCSATVEVYDRGSGAERATVALPDGSKARGLAWLNRYQGRPARLFVAIPTAARLLTYNAATLAGSSTPSKRTAITRPGTNKRAVPAGVTVDKRGQLSVSDVSNQAIYRYDTTKGAYHRYQVLGHPPRASDADGYLDYPAALAQYPQDRGGFSGNLFIADTRNGRVQRWDVGGGYTFWARTLKPPAVGEGTDPTGPSGPTDPDPSEPTATTTPKVTATTDATGLRCDTGVWTGAPATYTFNWLRDGVVRAGVVGNVYPLTAADDGTEIACRVTARTTSGDIGTATSAPWYVGAAVAPTSTSRPVIVGTPARDNTLLCDTGGWTGLPTPSFSYVWLRDGVQVGSSPSYRVRTADLGASLTCTVIATNQAGSASATSVAVVAAGVGSGEDPDGPCTGTPRVVIAGGAATIGDPHVSLAIVPPVGYTGIEVSNTPDFAVVTPVTLTASCTTPWRLAVPASDATPALVFVRWVGGPSAGGVVSDSVSFDRTGPQIDRATVRFIKRAWRLRVAAQDPSGLRVVTYGRTQKRGLRTVSYRASIRVSAPHNVRWVRVSDRLGNASNWHRVS